MSCLQSKNGIDGQSGVRFSESNLWTAHTPPPHNTQAAGKAGTGGLENRMDSQGQQEPVSEEYLQLSVGGIQG